MMKRLSLFLLCTLLSFAGALAQERTVRGTVIASDDRSPLVGASVQIPQSELTRLGVGSRSIGATTDLDGKFSLTLPNGVRTLVVRYIGYQDYSLALSSTGQVYSISLHPESKSLESVVVTGYQTVEKRKLTAAISKVELSDAILGSIKSVDQALAGHIAGVSVTSTSGAPGSPARIRIRGTASLNGTQDPLWVLDGIPLEGTDIPRVDSSNDNDILNIGQSSIAGLSPADIESITILKDAAATAIYGARAANGVIVVTTKRGRNGRPTFAFSSRLSYSPTLSTERLNLLNADEKVGLELSLLSAGLDPMTYASTFAEKGGVADILRQHSLLETYRDSGWSALSPEAQRAINALRGINTNWSDILFRDALTQEYNLSISGGTDKVTYYNSVGWSNEQGNVAGVGMQRLNLTSKTQYQANRLLKLGASVFVNRRTSDAYVSDKYGFINPVYYSRIANPYHRAHDEAGAYVYDYNVMTGNQPDQTRGFNIFEERAGTSSQTTTTALNAIFDAELKLGQHWRLTSQLGLQWEQSEQDELIGQSTYTMRDLYQNSRYWDSTTKTYKHLVPEGGRHRVANRVTGQITWKGMAEYKKTFADIHDLQVMMGSELRQNRYSATTSTAWGYNPKTLTSRPLLFRTESEASSYPQHVEVLTKNAFASFFANGSYTLLDRYTLGASVRLDGSDLFGVDEKYRYLPIYSLSGMWRIGNEAFLKDVSWLDNLALRASYGLQGNIDKNTSPYLVGTYATVSLLPGTTEDAISIHSAPNSRLRWERTASYNLGLDFSALSGAINLGLDYYHRKGTDLIATQSLPLESGFRSMTINWAEMTNQGVELNIQTRNIATKHFSWHTNFNFAYNQNRVQRVMTPENQTTPSLEGYPVGAIFAIPTSGIDPNNGRVLISNGDGTSATLEDKFKLVDEWGIGFYTSGITPAEERKLYQYSGTSDAPYTGGIMNTFAYKAWELSFNLAYYLGAHVRTAPSYSVVDFDPGRNTNRDILSRWSAENTSGTMPALVMRTNLPADYSLLSDRPQIYRNLDMWIRPLNYFRLQNLRLAYMLPTDFTKRIGLKGATVALEGRNLLVFGSSYRNYLDPESQSNLYATPVAKSFTLNVNLNF